MKRALVAGDRNAERVRGYYSTRHVDEKQLEPNGSVRTETTKTYDHVLIQGLLIRKLVEKEWQAAASVRCACKEDERVNRAATSRKEETSSEKAKRFTEEERKRIKSRAFGREVYDAFEFRLVGEEQVEGRKNWVIEATPMPGYEPKEIMIVILSHLSGKVWIDQQDFLWTKAEATATSPSPLDSVSSQSWSKARIFMSIRPVHPMACGSCRSPACGPSLMLR